jgi:hypothetical protein
MHWSIVEMILDLLQNSVEARASSIFFEINLKNPDIFAVTIRDNGVGMDQEEIKRAMDPFWSRPDKHPQRSVGLGIPFLIQTVEQTAGTWNIDSTRGWGTQLLFTLNRNHVDLPPLGDVAELVIASMCFVGEYDLTFRYMTAGEECSVSRRELESVLGDVADITNRRVAVEYVRSMIS